MDNVVRNYEMLFHDLLLQYRVSKSTDSTTGDTPVSSKIIAIISTGEAGKARTGIAFALNAMKKDWLEDVKIFIFGPAEALLLKDHEIQNMLKEYQQMDETVVACKNIADRDGISKEIAALGIRVELIGNMISDLMKDGYAPMVW
jgi:hypothetical protein